MFRSYENNEEQEAYNAGWDFYEGRLSQDDITQYMNNIEILSAFQLGVEHATRFWE